MTFAVLRALHGIIGEALDEIEAVYALHGSQNKPSMARDKEPDPAGCSPSTGTTRPSHRPTLSINSLSNVYASPPPSPCIKTENSYESLRQPPLDFPSLDAPYDPSSLSETLTQHPDVVAAINRIVAACGQVTSTVQTPFLTICDAVMGYHLPSCMRLFEASHTPEILREAGPAGLHVDSISEKNGVNKTKLAHTLRLLATHHIVRELSPDVFTLNRISSTIDTGKCFQNIQLWAVEGVPEKKYEDTSGIAAFVGLCSDEIYKSSAYMTETYLLSQSETIRAGSEPTKAPFCFAFGTVESKTGFFGWLEGSPIVPNPGSSPDNTEGTRQELETGRGALYAPVKRHMGPGPSLARENPNSSRFRLERFGKAMSGTCSWETPGAILNSFEWHSLPRNSVIVDVGGGIGSTSMLLASAFSSADDNGLDLRFIIQDRPIVVEMGEKAWKAKRPEFLENGTAIFQVHNFFTPQPVKQAAVFLLRVVLHDWPDDFARRILLQLREAAAADTKLLLGDFILPLACPDETNGDASLDGIRGTESMLAPPPLLPNLGKASANAYWMDLTMQVMFNAQERTLREIVALTASAGWRVTKVTTCIGSLFGYIVAVPTTIPSQTRYQSTGSAIYRDPAFAIHKSQEPWNNEDQTEERDLIERSSSRCGTPTFGSRMQLSFVEEALSRFGGGILRPRKHGATRTVVPPRTALLKQPITLKPVPPVKKKPSPLSEPPLATPPPPTSPATKGFSSPKQSFQAPNQKRIPRRLSLASLRASSLGHEPPPPLPNARAPPSPMSPQSLARKTSFAQLSSSHGHARSRATPLGSGPAPPSLIPELVSSFTSQQEHEVCDHGSSIPLPISTSLTVCRREGDERELPTSPKVLQSQNRSMTRRSSLAQLHVSPSFWKATPPSPLQAAAKIELRKRTKSVTGLFARASQHTASLVVSEAEPPRGNDLGRAKAGSSRLGGFLARGGGGTSLRFEKGRDVDMLGGSPEFPSLVDVDPGVLIGGDGENREGKDDDDVVYEPVSVLAAAARIEKRVLRRRGSP